MNSWKSRGLGETIRQALRIDRAFSLVWKSSRCWAFINLMLVAVQGALPLVTLFLIKQIIDEVTGSLTAVDKSEAFQGVLFWIILAGVAALVTALCRSLSDFSNEAQSMIVTDHVLDELHAQSISVDLQYYENPRFYNTLHRAQKEATFRPTRMVNGLIDLGTSSLALGGIGVLLFAYNWFIGLILFGAAFPAALVQLWYSRKLYSFEQEQVEKERKAWYYHIMMTDPASAKEIRLFDLGGLFKARFVDLRRRLREGRIALARYRSFRDLLAQGLSILAIFGTFAFISYQTTIGLVTIGGLVMYYQGFQRGLNFLRSIFRSIVSLYSDNLFLNHYYQLMDLAPTLPVPVNPFTLPSSITEGIEFRGVSFSYPISRDAVLKNIDLKIGAGEIIALVGENGSGKTTLVKLLCRLYDPQDGLITIDGVDLRQVDPAGWRKKVSVLFQDYVHYSLPVWENIWLGNVETEQNMGAIIEAARLSGADTAVRRLPQGYDTLLGLTFDKGQELSIGEWQKLALARSFFRDAQLIVLDEPTSSLDPLAEAELFRKFRRILGGRSAILISHRFSTVQMADRIYVMDRGEILERGTHQQLLEQNGPYARLFRAQAEHYN